MYINRFPHEALLVWQLPVALEQTPVKLIRVNPKPGNSVEGTGGLFTKFTIVRAAACSSVVEVVDDVLVVVVEVVELVPNDTE
jgi:hypothetical protein